MRTAFGKAGTRQVNDDYGNGPINVRCNKVPRDLFSAREYAAKHGGVIPSEFAYIEENNAMDESRLFEYLGSVYDYHEFMGGAFVPKWIKALGFDAYDTNSHWSGIVIGFFDIDGNLIDDGDRILVGRYWN